MVMNATFSDTPFARATRHHGETVEERLSLVAQIIESLGSEDSTTGFVNPGEDAWIFYSDRPFSDDFGVRWRAESYLRAAVNRTTGYGALIWWADGTRDGRTEVDSWIWISDNPEPPAFDPRVVADPGYPLFHHPRSALPINQVRAALEEFARLGTGDRPECVSWTKGDPSGRRDDQESSDEDEVEVPYPENPWG